VFAVFYLDDTECEHKVRVYTFLLNSQFISYIIHMILLVKI
jgi:hypothetical protein